MAGIPSDLGGKPQAPQFGGIHDAIMAQLAGGGADPDQGEDTQLSQLVADAHKLAAGLTHFAMLDQQEDQGPPMPPAAAGGLPPQGM